MIRFLLAGVILLSAVAAAAWLLAIRRVKTACRGGDS